MTRKRELILRLGVAIYSLCIVCFCFTPQPQLPTGVETPGIQTFGRLVFLLTPFNSFWKLGEVTSLLQLFWIFLQNALNILLLFPLVFQLLYLYPNLRKTKKILFLSFLLSLGIECTQLVLDFFFDFNRVFEIDDLWINTLGGYLAWVLYRKLNVTKLTKELK
ncbi:VanZ family protein [Streptococcus oralis]|uniref:VanZ family protein n=1 Tax=Streptococcus oralis TaxID=1303 RepID=UPI001C058B4B|nr:VanZ family protein [Streptococcus oralis]MBU0454476.1 VanZ family protein [Streptococcus oralis]MBZ2093983.1 VanZ family protein [Streptococcus oralis]MBZ2098172.1 VanZ family protein [Streptococcus oralis]QXW62100.1 VanZ family protein [Streptococcus oralis]